MGSLASGATVQAVLVPASLVFCFFYHREILMDIADAQGGRLGGKRNVIGHPV